MTDNNLGGNALRILAAALSIALLAALILVGWASMGSGADPAEENAGRAGMAQVQGAYVRARIALGGSEAAFVALEDASKSLESVSTEGLSRAQQEWVAEVRSAVTAIRNGRDDVLMLHESSAQLDELAPQLSDASYALEGSLDGERTPVMTVQLERLRLLAESAARDVQALAAGAGDPNEIAQRVLNVEMAIRELVRGLSSGDAGLGLRGITADEAVGPLSRLEDLAALMGTELRRVLAVTDKLSVIRQATRQLDAAALKLGPVDQQPRGSVGGGPSSGLLTVAAGILIAAVLLLLGMVVVYRRGASARRATEAQAEQTEKNQAAILKLLDELGSLADGDLTVQATVSQDITGAIADSINYAVEALRELVTTINGSAGRVDSAVRQTQQTARQLSTATEAQSRQITAASTAITSMATSIEEVSGNAERSSDVARHSVDVALKGSEAVRRTIEGMNTIRETIQETSKRIKRLGESSQEIGNIVELINDIADQTNILALNASIQASMAGEAGRGFAVVADEVQRLAERSANATRQIEVLVRTIQSDTNEAVVSMERSTTDVVGGALLAENAGAALDEIEQVSNQIAMLVQNISTSAREQGGAAETVTHNMDVLQEINAQTAESTEATTRSITELTALARELSTSVAGFRLPVGSEAAQHADDDQSAEGDADDDEVDADPEEFADQRTA